MASALVGQAMGIAQDAGNEALLRTLPKFWQDGICDCGKDSQICLDVFFCFPCNIARQCSAIDGIPNNMDCGYCCCTLVAAYMGNFGVGVVASILRYRMIEKYNIIGEGAIMASALGLFCTPCSLCQTSRHLTLLGQNPGGTCCVPTQPPQVGPHLMTSMR